jgi:hypothetical protein
MKAMFSIQSMPRLFGKGGHSAVLTNPVSEGITVPPCCWGIWIWEPGTPGWGSPRWDSEVWLRVMGDSDHWVITMQIADPSARPRGRPTETRPQISDNTPIGSNIWSQVPQGCSTPRHTDWLTVSHKVTSNFELFRQEVISGRKSHNGAWYQDILTDCQS